jgi:transcriptional/translational regulatory protein YebC/TACO1
VITVPSSATDEERLIEIALEAGADDVAPAGDVFEVTTQPDAFEAVKDALDKAGLKPGTAELAMVAQTNVSLTGDPAGHALKLLEELEDHDDVQDVASNLDIPQEELERLSAA